MTRSPTWKTVGGGLGAVSQRLAMLELTKEGGCVDVAKDGAGLACHAVSDQTSLVGKKPFKFDR